MKEIIIGMIYFFLLICIGWYFIYFMEEFDKDMEPPKIIKIIGKIEFITTLIGVIITICYFLGYCITH